MAGVAGRKALVKVTGAAVSFTAEATTMSDADTVYTITNTAKRIWDQTATITVLDGGVAVNAALDPYSINRLTGVVTFDGAAVRVITVTGSYLPASTAVGAKRFTYTLDRAALDDTDYDSANTNSGFDSKLPGLKKISGSIGRNWSSDTYFTDALTTGLPVVIEFYSDRSSSADMKCWALLNKDALQSALGGKVDADVEFEGTTDADSRSISLG